MPKQPKAEPKKPGRPKLSAEEAKGKIVPVRFAPDEFERIAEAASAANQTVSQWIRSAVRIAAKMKLA
jgi:uncharacterized protein (DUF1778 family)